MKPIPTLSKPLETVNIKTHKPVKAAKERSDCCAVPSAGIVGEAMLAFAISNVFLQKFGEDNIEEIKNNFEKYTSGLEER